MDASLSPQEVGFDRARLRRLDDWMARNVEIGRFSGSSLLISRGGAIAYLSMTGLRSVDDHLPYERDTIVRIYSMTKPITSVALMMLVERGLLHLSAPVSRFLPEFSQCHALIADAVRVDQTEPVATPTIHQLLLHTSGLTYGFNPGLLSQHYTENRINFDPGSGGLDQAVKRAAAMPLAFPPGTGWEYSIGIDVIGRVIEVVSGMALDRFLAMHIFEPLGMTDTSFSVPPDRIDRFADCYTWTGEGAFECTDQAVSSAFRETSVSTFSGGGGLVSTLDDYLRFGEMLRCGGAFGDVRLLSPGTIRFMRANHLGGDIASMGTQSFNELPMQGQGFGIGGGVVIDAPRTGVIGSKGDFGWGGMASTFFWTDPVEDLTCVFFTQLIPSSSYPARAELKALVHAALIT